MIFEAYIFYSLKLTDFIAIKRSFILFQIFVECCEYFYNIDIVNNQITGMLITIILIGFKIQTQIRMNYQLEALYLLYILLIENNIWKSNIIKQISMKNNCNR